MEAVVLYSVRSVGRVEDVVDLLVVGRVVDGVVNDGVFMGS